MAGILETIGTRGIKPMLRAYRTRNAIMALRALSPLPVQRLTALAWDPCTPRLATVAARMFQLG